MTVNSMGVMPMMMSMVVMMPMMMVAVVVVMVSRRVLTLELQIPPHNHRIAPCNTSTSLACSVTSSSCWVSRSAGSPLARRPASD